MWTRGEVVLWCLLWCSFGAVATAAVLSESVSRTNNEFLSQPLRHIHWMYRHQLENDCGSSHSDNAGLTSVDQSCVSCDKDENVEAEDEVDLDLLDTPLPGAPDFHKTDEHAAPQDDPDEERNSKDRHPHHILQSIDDILRVTWQEMIPAVPSLDTIHHEWLSLHDTKTYEQFMKVNGTDRMAFFRQVLSQFLFPLPITSTKTSSMGSAATAVTAKRPNWLDPEFVLQFKGLARLTLFPQLSAHYDPIVMKKLSRALRIVSPSQQQTPSSATITPNGLYFLHWTIIRALAYSLQVHLLPVNLKTINKVRQVAQERWAVRHDGEPKRVTISKQAVLTALFAVIQEFPSSSSSFSPSHSMPKTIIVFNDHLDWLLRNEAASHVVLQEVRRVQDSSILFVAIEPNNDELRAGVMRPSDAISSQSAAPSLAEENALDEESLSLSAPASDQPTEQSDSVSSARSMGLWHHSASSASVPVMESRQPTAQSTAGSGSVVTARGFSIAIRHTNATITPLCESSMPLPSANTLQPNPEEIKHLILQQQQQQQQSGLPPLPSFIVQLFPATMSDEDVESFLRDAHNQPRIKATFDWLVSLVGQQLPLLLHGRQSTSPIAQVFISLPQGPAIMPDKPHLIGSPIHFHPVVVKSTPTSGSMSTAAEKSTSDGQKKLSLKKSPAAVSVAPKMPTATLPEQESEEQTEILDSSAALQQPNKNSKSSLSHRLSMTAAQSLDQDSQDLSLSGKLLMNLFEDVMIDTPRDHTLKTLWNSFVDEDVGVRIAKANRRLLRQELRRANIHHERNALQQFDESLRRQVMSRDQAKEAILSAVKLEAGRQTMLTEWPSTTLNPTAETISTPLSDESQSSVRISQWSLDIALSSLLKSTSPRLGRPTARSQKDMAQLSLDKHEKALLSNVVTPQDLGVSYEMIGGLEDVKEILRQCVTYPLKYPRLYQQGIAAEAVKGLLLFGPPGTGKTMLAKAVATEGGATFLSIDASTIESKWLGESEKNARAVFSLARKLAPCVVYLDEVDSILSSREHGDESSHGTLTSVKTTLMQEWDGLKTTKDRVVVIASTNRPFDLDEAVLRRLPRRIMVDLPNAATRKDILEVTLTNNNVDRRDVDFDQLAELLEGYTGSDVKEVCREAVVHTAHERAMFLEHGILPESMKRVNQTNAEKEETDQWVMELTNVDAPLRPVRMADFHYAMSKLKASVSDRGRELQKVLQWNEKYGEVKKAKKKFNPSAQVNLYI